MSSTTTVLSMPQACRKAGVPYMTMYNALLRGAVEGEQQPRGRWEIDEASLDRYIEHRAHVGA